MTRSPTLSPAAPEAPVLTELLAPTGAVFFLRLPGAELPPALFEPLGLFIVAVPSMIFPPSVPLFQFPALGRETAQESACASTTKTRSWLSVARGSATSCDARK